MFCPYCGKENPDDAKFCIRCGKEILKPEIKKPISTPRIEEKEVQQEVVTRKRDMLLLISFWSGLSSLFFIWFTGIPALIVSLIAIIKRKMREKYIPKLAVWGLVFSIVLPFVGYQGIYYRFTAEYKVAKKLELPKWKKFLTTWQAVKDYQWEVKLPSYSRHYLFPNGCGMLVGITTYKKVSFGLTFPFEIVDEDYVLTLIFDFLRTATNNEASSDIVDQGWWMGEKSGVRQLTTANFDIKIMEIPRDDGGIIKMVSVAEKP